jgi:hypothetical protein
MKVKVLLAVLLVLGSAGWITSIRLALGQRLQAEALVANLGKARGQSLPHRVELVELRF